MKNIKMATKISLVIITVLLIAFAALIGIVNVRTRAAMEETTVQRMTEATEARAELISQYIGGVEQSVKEFAQSNEVKQLLQHKEDEAAYQNAQKYLDGFAATIDYLEGLFVHDYDTKQLAHSIHEAVGSYASDEGEERDAMHRMMDTMFQTKEGYFEGIFQSPSSGAQVIVNYYPVFADSGEGIGMVGIAVKTEGLLDILNSLEFQGLEHAEYYLLDVVKKQYVFAQDDSLIGKEVEDENIEKMISFTSGSGEKKSGTFHYKDVSAGEAVSAVYQSMPAYQWTFIISDADSEVFASVNALSVLVLVICVAVLCLVAVITAFVARFIAKDIVLVGKIVGETAETMDMTKVQQIHHFLGRKDEAGQISKAVFDLSEGITKVVRTLQAKGKQLYDTSENLADMTSKTRENMEQMDEAVADIAEGATSQAHETESASANVLEIGTQILNTNEATESLMETSELMRRSSMEVSEVVKQLMSIGQKTSEAVDEIYEQTNMTNQSASKIKDATDLITSIAEETSLLSLNASIEAARAGEQGKGFAVVAAQIQQLAEQSNDSAKRIEDIIKILVKDSENAVKTMDGVKKIIQEQTEYVSQTSRIFGSVSDGIRDTLEGLNDISEKTQQMDQTRKNVVVVVENLSAIAEENAAGTEETSASVSMVNELMQNITDMTKDVANVAEELEGVISEFTI